MNFSLGVRIAAPWDTRRLRDSAIDDDMEAEVGWMIIVAVVVTVVVTLAIEAFVCVVVVVLGGRGRLRCWVPKKDAPQRSIELATPVAQPPRPADDAEPTRSDEPATGGEETAVRVDVDRSPRPHSSVSTISLLSSALRSARPCSCWTTVSSEIRYDNEDGTYVCHARLRIQPGCPMAPHAADGVDAAAASSRHGSMSSTAAAAALEDRSTTNVDETAPIGHRHHGARSDHVARTSSSDDRRLERRAISLHSPERVCRRHRRSMSMSMVEDAAAAAVARRRIRRRLGRYSELSVASTCSAVRTSRPCSCWTAVSSEIRFDNEDGMFVYETRHKIPIECPFVPAATGTATTSGCGSMPQTPRTSAERGRSGDGDGPAATAPNPETVEAPRRRITFIETTDSIPERREPGRTDNDDGSLSTTSGRTADSTVRDETNLSPWKRESYCKCFERGEELLDDDGVEAGAPAASSTSGTGRPTSWQHHRLAAKPILRTIHVTRQRIPHHQLYSDLDD